MSIFGRKQGNREEIDLLANSYWVARGCQGGSAQEDWLRAEEEIKLRETFKLRANRTYEATPLPTLKPSSHGPQQELLLTIYKEVCTSWRTLTDVRFKLLGLVLGCPKRPKITLDRCLIFGPHEIT